MRDALRIEARDMIGERFARLGQHHRTATEDGTQENLKAAIAPDVIEGRPYRQRAAGRTVGDDGAGQSLQRMADDLRHARGAGGQHQPFGGTLGLYLCAPARRRAGRHHFIDAEIRPARRLIGDDGIDLGIVDQGLDMIGIEIGRTQQHPPRHAVDFRHRERRYQLIGDRKQHRAVGEFVEAADQAGLFKDVRQRYDATPVRNGTTLQLRTEIVTEREDFTRGHFHRP